MMEFTRKGFLGFGGAFLASSAFAAANQPKDKDGKVIAGFDETDAGRIAAKKWEPFSEKKVRVGIAGHGLCKFGCQFGYQNHPNVEVVACTDLDPARCAAMQKELKAPRTFRSCEEMIREMRGKMDAVYIATDPPSHAPLAILAMENGMHAVSAVPAFWGDIQEEYAQKLIDTVKKTGMTYQMNETTAFRPQAFAMRALYEGGALGKIIYTEGEYWHHGTGPMGSYNGWRNFAPPQWYCTHGNGFYTCVTGKSFVKTACLGVACKQKHFSDAFSAPGNFGNRFKTEIALLRTSDGGIARMGKMGDCPKRIREMGCFYGTKGNYIQPWPGKSPYEGLVDVTKLADWHKPALPPGMPAGGHGGSHGYLTDDFIRAILLGTKPVCDVYCAVNTTLPGLYMHRSAVKDGEWMTIPQFTA
mgnify:CR=1 FL=1